MKRVADNVGAKVVARMNSREDWAMSDKNLGSSSMIAHAGLQFVNTMTLLWRLLVAVRIWRRWRVGFPVKIRAL